MATLNIEIGGVWTEIPILQGKSAYQSALSAIPPYVGTEEEFNTLLANDEIGVGASVPGGAVTYDLFVNTDEYYTDEAVYTQTQSDSLFNPKILQTNVAVNPVSGNAIYNIHPNTSIVFDTPFTSSDSSNISILAVPPTTTNGNSLQECKISFTLTNIPTGFSIGLQSGTAYYMDKVAPTLTAGKSYTYVFSWLTTNICEIYYSIKQ